MPKVIGAYNIKYLDHKEVIDLAKKFRSVQLTTIEPRKIINDSIYCVSIREFDVSLISNKLYYGRKGGSDVKFKYDSIFGQFKVIEMVLIDQ